MSSRLLSWAAWLLRAQLADEPSTEFTHAAAALHRLPSSVMAVEQQHLQHSLSGASATQPLYAYDSYAIILRAEHEANPSEFRTWSDRCRACFASGRAQLRLTLHGLPAA